MRNVSGFRALVVIGLAWTMGLVSSGADDPTDAEKAQEKRRTQQFKESIDWYRVFSPREPKEPMKPETIQRWSNPTRLQKGETALVMWADAGRPEALASVYPWKGSLVYECVSLARDPGLNAKEGDRSIWSPNVSGVTYREVPDAPSPSATATARLNQMRAIAEPLKVTMISVKNGQADREEMRLLPKPIYRYDLSEAKLIHPNLIDGAMFAYVQGTDPEAVVLIEAVRTGDRTTYQYAFARATGWTVEIRLGPQLLWTAPDVRWNAPKSPVIAVGRPLVD